MSAFDNRSKDDLEVEIRNFLEENTIGDLLAVVKWCIESKVEDAFESKDYAECVIEELEKIKARLNHRANEHLDGDYYVRIRDINEVFDEELAELKGE